jgi:prephenate dehydrogenase
LRDDAVFASHDVVFSQPRHPRASIRFRSGSEVGWPARSDREVIVPSDLSDATGSDDDAGPSDHTEPDAEAGSDSDAEADGAVAGFDGAATGSGLDGSLLVVGAGAVGRWIAGVLDCEDTAFCDTDPRVASEAAVAIGGRVVDPDSAERFDVVAVAVPIPAATEAIATHAPRAKRAVFDATGTMREPVAAMAEHAPDLERLSLHPLFAPEHAPGTVAIVTDAAESAGGNDNRERGSESDADSVAAAIAAALRAAGNDPFVTSPEEHDRAMKTVQARTHVAVLAFALAAEPVDERFHTPVSRALAEITTRVTSGDPAIYAEIQATFDGSEDVTAAAARIADASDQEFEALYREAGEFL